MKILFDKNVPRPLRRFLGGHEVVEAESRGWGQLKNGQLLAAAEEGGFDVFVSCDRNLGYQQTVQNRPIAILIIGAGTWPRILPHGNRIAEAVNRISRGEYVEVDIQ